MEMKEKFKKIKASYNDVFMTITTNVMAEYFESQGYKGDQKL